MSLRAVSWIVPTALAALAAALIAAVIVARTERPSRALIEATPGIVSAGRGTPPEIAAINAQLAQIAALRAHALYGSGLTHVVGAPVASLRPVLGEEWRELGAATGRVYVRPTGTRSRYFEVSAVAVAQHGPARLEILTSEGQHVVESASMQPFQVINVGPLVAPQSGGVGLALSSLQPHTASTGASIVLSPLQAEYLAPGEWVTSMPALSETGPGGLRGVYLERGSKTSFAITPGVRGRCELVMRAAGIGGSPTVAVRVGSEVRTVHVAASLNLIRVGPFSHSSEAVSLAVNAAASGTSIFVSKIQLVAVPR